MTDATGTGGATDDAHEALVQGGALDPRLVGYAEEAFTTPRRRAEVAALTKGERQSLVARMLVRTPTFTRTVAAVRAMHMPVTGGHPQGQMIGGVIGDTRVGKSWALKHYARSLGNVAVENVTLRRALYVPCYDGCTSVTLAATLRRELGLKQRKGSPALAFDHAVRSMKLLGVELLVLDDAQFALASKFAKTREEVTGFLRNTYDEGAACVVLAGDDGLDAAVRANPMLHARGSWPVQRVPPYDWSSDEDDVGEFRDTLDAIAERLPFRGVSDLGAAGTAAHLYKLSRGRIGVAMNYVRDAADAAIDDGSDRVAVDHLRAAAARRREVGDPYEPFVLRVSRDDPTGAGRAARAAASDGANVDPTLARKRPRQPFTERERS